MIWIRNEAYSGVQSGTWLAKLIMAAGSRTILTNDCWTLTLLSGFRQILSVTNFAFTKVFVRRKFLSHTILGYTIPKYVTHDQVMEAIEEMSLTDSPEAFGLHPNADITYQTRAGGDVLATIVDIQPKDSSGGGGETREEKGPEFII